MKQLLVMSGKGGTGKTTLTASFAALTQNLIMADCDVDAADLHLLLQPEIVKREDFYGGKMVEIDQSRCQQCLKCEKICRFQAISHTMDSVFWNIEVKVNPILCEGCTLCRYICPHEAISVKNNHSGEWYVSHTRFGLMIHAALGIGEENSGKLVSRVLEEARHRGEQEGKAVLLVDGPPGIGCPVIASFSGTDLALLVTEPTVAGLHDLERALELARHFQVKSLVCINKADLDEGMAETIRNYCTEHGVEVVGMIPFDRAIPEAISLGKIPLEYQRSGSTRAILEVYSRVMQTLSE